MKKAKIIDNWAEKGRKNNGIFWGNWVDAMIWYNLTGQVLEGYKLGEFTKYEKRTDTR